jgi:hypothetical protein
MLKHVESAPCIRDVRGFCRRSKCVECIVIFCSLICLIPDGIAQTNSLIVPQERANAFGDTYAGNQIIFPADADQQVYYASSFASPEGDILEITGLSFRLLESADSSLDIVIPRLTLSLSASTPVRK